MVNRRQKALMRLWKDRCTVYLQHGAADPDTGLTAFEEQLLYEALPCKLSFETLPAAGAGSTAQVSQAVKLLLSAEYDIPAGSRIEVARGGRMFCYRRSGEPGIFTDHQEIPLELAKERA